MATPRIWSSRSGLRCMLRLECGKTLPMIAAKANVRAPGGIFENDRQGGQARSEPTYSTGGARMTDDAGGWADRLKSALWRVFPERQVIIRTDARPRDMRLTPGPPLGGWGGRRG